MQLAEMNDPMNVKERIMIVSSKDGNLPHLVHVSYPIYNLTPFFEQLNASIWKTRILGSCHKLA